LYVFELVLIYLDTNLQPKNKEEEKNKQKAEEAEKLGSGRVIPIKQVK